MKGSETVSQKNSWCVEHTLDVLVALRAGMSTLDAMCLVAASV